MSEHLLVNHCSPTLAGLKTGNLFNCGYGSVRQLYKSISQWNRILNPKGVCLKVMRVGGGRALIYVYRRERLAGELESEAVRRFLQEFGYKGDGLDNMLDRLAERLGSEETFPHEIGVFLGYPFADVKAFIENKGKNYKHAGLWKVYSDESAARKTFARYKKCTDIYRRMLAEGADLRRLTV